MFHIPVKTSIIIFIQNLFVDTEDVLCLCCIVDNPCRPLCGTVFAIVITAGIDMPELICDRCTFNDFMHAAGNDVMFYIQSKKTAEGIDSGKPCFHPWIQNNRLSKVFKHLRPQWNILHPELMHQHVQICTDRIHLIFLCKVRDLLPERTCIIISQCRNQTVFLHILCT